MDQGFIAILQKLVSEQGREALLNSAKCKAFLADYTRGEYKKESRLLLQALETGVQKAIDTTEELEICKKQQARVLREEYFIAEDAATDIVDVLALVLRGKQESGTTQEVICSNCGKELQKEWKSCPYCSTLVAKKQQNPPQSELVKKEAPEAKSPPASLPSPTPYMQTVNLGTTSNNTNQQNAETSFNSGMTYYNNHKYDEAIAQFSKTIQLSPYNTLAYNWRGHAYMKKEQYDMAINDFGETIRLEPNNPWYYVDCGRTYRQLGQRNQAIRNLEKAISLDPTLRCAKKELQEIQEY